MLLYKHSARCPIAVQMFLNCNPQYWSLVPMLKTEAEQDNQYFHSLPDSIPEDPTSHFISSPDVRSDHEAGTAMNDLPPFPSDQYTFSNRQCMEQFQFFKTKQDLYKPNAHLDLYQATIIVLRMFQLIFNTYILYFHLNN